MASDPGSGGIRLRPLGIADLLDETFRVYRRHFLAFLVAMAVVVVPTMLVQRAVSAVFDPLMASESLPTTASGLVTYALTILVASVLTMAVFSLVHVVGESAAGGAAAVLAANAILGRPVTVRKAYQQAFRRYQALLRATVVTSLKVFLLAITIVGLYHAIRRLLAWSLVYQAIMLEGEDAPGSMRRSAALADGHRLRLLALGIILSLLSLVLISGPDHLIRYVFRLIQEGSDAAFWVAPPDEPVTWIVNAVTGTLVGGLNHIAMTLIYYDLRVRKEAFDLEQGAVRLALPSDSDRAPT